MKIIPPTAPVMPIDEPKTPTERTTIHTKSYVPNLAREKAYWKERMDGIFDILNSVAYSSSASDLDRLEAEAAARCTAMVYLEQFLGDMAKCPSRRSDFFKMKIHHLLSTIMRNDQRTNEHLVVAEKLYDEMLEEYPSKDKSDINTMGELIRMSREQLGPVEMSKEGGHEANISGEDVLIESENEGRDVDMYASNEEPYSPKLPMLIAALNAVNRGPWNFFEKQAKDSRELQEIQRRVKSERAALMATYGLKTEEELKERLAKVLTGEAEVFDQERMEGRE
jgi:hypothetical protein